MTFCGLLVMWNWNPARGACRVRCGGAHRRPGTQ